MEKKGFINRDLIDYINGRKSEEAGKNSTPKSISVSTLKKQGSAIHLSALL
jgi:hypothetical protein